MSTGKCLAEGSGLDDPLVRKLLVRRRDNTEARRRTAFLGEPGSLGRKLPSILAYMVRRVSLRGLLL